MENIDIIQQFGNRNGADNDVHYAPFSQLAAFFGREMQPHRHERYFQLHSLTRGKIELWLDDTYYSLRAPLIIITPPSVVHAVITDNDSEGHVLTVRQELICPIVQALWPAECAVPAPALCLSLADRPQEQHALDHLWALLAEVFTLQRSGRDILLTLLAQSLFTLVLRETESGDSAAVNEQGAMKLFQRFNQMVNESFRAHLTVPDYAHQLGISESRLNELCHHLANMPPKRLVFERMMREARRQLLFSGASVNQIAGHLGYKDPAYFSRFFHRLAGCSPSEFRRR